MIDEKKSLIEKLGLSARMIFGKKGFARFIKYKMSVEEKIHITSAEVVYKVYQS